MKKVISIFIVLLIIMSLTTDAYAIDYPTDINAPEIAKPRITVSEKQAEIGENINLRIALENNPGIVSMSLKISFDETALTLIDVQDSGRIGSHFHKPQYSSPYSLVWANDTATTNFTTNGIIASLKFKVNESAITGYEYPITVSYDKDNYDIYNKDIETVDFNVENGLVTIINKLPVTPISDFTYHFVRGDIYITAYNGSDTEVYIPESYNINGAEHFVTSIDESAFEGNITLTDLSLPATIETIGAYAFYDCTSLTNVTLWCKNAEIGEKAFGYYYVSKKVDGKVANFDLTAYAGGTAESYLSENGLSFSAQTQPVGIGDIDADGEYGSSDLTAIIDHLLLKEEIETEVIDFADINSDGDINILDLVCLKRKIADL